MFQSREVAEAWLPAIAEVSARACTYSLRHSLRGRGDHYVVFECDRTRAVVDSPDAEKNWYEQTFSIKEYDGVETLPIIKDTPDLDVIDVLQGRKIASFIFPLWNKTEVWSGKDLQDQLGFNVAQFLGSNPEDEDCGEPCTVHNYWFVNDYKLGSASLEYIGFCVDFHEYDDWPEYTWRWWESLLALHSEEFERSFVRTWNDAIEGRLDDASRPTRMGGLEPWEWEDQIDFLCTACGRNPAWWLLAEGYLAVEVLMAKPELIESNLAAQRAVDYCNHGGAADNGAGGLSETGFYLEQDVLPDDGLVNGWTRVLMTFPQLADKCTTFDKFGGFSACMLLRKQPQLADCFSLESLDDFSSDCWQNAYSAKEDFDCAWGCLAKAQPQFAKYCK